MTKRIYLESRTATGAPGPGHLYLVFREDGQPDLVIQGTTNNPFTDILRVKAGVGLQTTTDQYYSGDTLQSRNSREITDLLGLGAMPSAADVQSKWNTLVAYANGIDSAGYDYELPVGSSHVANSNAVILSALNAINVDLRTLPGPAPSSSSYVDSNLFTFSFPGACNETCHLGSSLASHNSFGSRTQ